MVNWDYVFGAVTVGLLWLTITMLSILHDRQITEQAQAESALRVDAWYQCEVQP